MLQSHRSRQPRIVALLLAAALCVGAGVYAYRLYQAHEQQAELFHEAEAEEKLLASLEQVVTIEFGREVSLQSWLAEFTRQTGVPVSAPFVYSTADPFSGEEPTPGEYREYTLALEIRSLAAYRAIDRVAAHFGWHWELRDDGTVLLKHESDRFRHDQVFQQFELAPKQAGKAGSNWQEFGYESLQIWRLFVEPEQPENSSVDTRLTPHSVLFYVTRRKQLAARHYFRQLQIARERLRGLPASAPHTDPVWQPTELSEQWFPHDSGIITQQLVAWPIADLTAGGDQPKNAYELRKALLEALRTQDIFDELDLSTSFIAEHGQLLILRGEANYQARLGRLLSTLRQVRRGSTGHESTAAATSPRSGELTARLDTQLPVDFRNATRAEVRDDLRFRGGIEFPNPEPGIGYTDRHLWGHLPARPLREQLELFLGDIEFDQAYFDHLTLAGQSPADDLAPWQYRLDVEVLQLSPWLQSPQHQQQLLQLLSLVRDEVIQEQAFTPFVYRGLLVVRCRPQLAPQLRQLVFRVTELLSPGEPRRWNGQPLMGAALSQPLELFELDQQAARREARVADLKRKLQLPVSARFRGEKLGDVLLGLAREYELPLVISEPAKVGAGAVPLLWREVERDAVEIPLGELLRQLLATEPGKSYWWWNLGYLTIEEGRPNPAEYDIHDFYFVEDLVVPRGPLQPGQLVRTLIQELQGNVRPNNSPFTWIHCDYYFRRVLGINSNTELPIRGQVQEVLRKLRSGELQPLPALDLDADRDFDIPDFAPYGVEMLPVVG